MKSFNELTISEILEIKREELDKWIDQECMIEGVAITTSLKPIKPDVPTYPHDTKKYGINGVYFDDFDTAEGYKEFLVVNYASRTEGYNDEKRFVTADMESYHFNISAESAYSEIQWRQIKDEKKKYDKILSVYKGDLSDWEEIYKGTKSIRKDIEELYEYYNDLKYDTSKLSKKFKRYAEISGNFSEAWKYFEVAETKNINELLVENNDAEENYFKDSLKDMCKNQ